MSCFSKKSTRGLALLAVVVLLQAGQAAAKEKSGEIVYQQVCQYCHETAIGPQIRSRQLPPVYIKQVVRHGLRAMPAFRPTEISDQELERVAAFVEGIKEAVE